MIQIRKFMPPEKNTVLLNVRAYMAWRKYAIATGNLLVNDLFKFNSVLPWIMRHILAFSLDRRIGKSYIG